MGQVRPPGTKTLQENQQFPCPVLGISSPPRFHGGRLASPAAGSLCAKALQVIAKLLTCQPPTLSLLLSSPWLLLDLPLSPPPSPPIISQLPPDQGMCFGHMLSLKQTLALEGVGSFPEPSKKGKVVGRYDADACVPH